MTLLASMAEIASVYNTDKNSVHSYVSEMYECTEFLSVL